MSKAEHSFVVEVGLNSAGDELTIETNLQEPKMVGTNLGTSVEWDHAAQSGGELSILATPIDNPDAEYLAETTKIDISGLPFGSTQNSITDGILTVSFSTPVEKYGPVPDGWLTWSSPPFSEDPNPYVLRADTTNLVLDLSEYVTIFGFELEPFPFSAETFIVEFYDNDELIESITRVVNGNSGARLFAREGDPINRVVITGSSNFAIAQVRYQLASPIPFWTTLAALVLIVILALILL
ncbi:MAG TPA: hypothetical protein PLM25_03460 [Limnochordia bacterium]|nr:hypothetical protein [Limnochordia bacterium]